MNLMSQAKTQKGIRWIWVIFGLFAAFLVAAFGMKAIEGVVSFYMTVDELANSDGQYFGRRLKLAGYVLEEGFVQERNRYEFLVAHEGHSIRVVYEGIAPDTFVPGVDVIVEGRTEDGNLFVADHLMAKCASKYEPGEAPAYWQSE